VIRIRPIACDRCHGKKIKCNARKPVCDRCLKLGHICTWNNTDSGIPQAERQVGGAGEIEVEGAEPVYAAANAFNEELPTVNTFPQSFPHDHRTAAQPSVPAELRYNQQQDGMTCFHLGAVDSQAPSGDFNHNQQASSVDMSAPPFLIADPVDRSMSWSSSGHNTNLDFAAMYGGPGALSVVSQMDNTVDSAIQEDFVIQQQNSVIPDDTQHSRRRYSTLGSKSTTQDSLVRESSIATLVAADGSPPRNTTTCTSCHRSHVPCEDGHPCLRCRRLDRHCVIRLPAQSGRPITRCDQCRVHEEECVKASPQDEDCKQCSSNMERGKCTWGAKKMDEEGRASKIRRPPKPKNKDEKDRARDINGTPRRGRCARCVRHKKPCLPGVGNACKRCSAAKEQCIMP
jgi:hypothetical protein